MRTQLVDGLFADLLQVVRFLRVYIGGQQPKELYMRGQQPKELYIGGQLPEDLYIGGRLPEDLYKELRYEVASFCVFT